MPTLSNNDISASHITQIALLGAAASGAGALAAAKIPVIRKGLEHMKTGLSDTTALCNNIPVLKHLLYKNPLLENPMLKDFLCINGMETVLLAGSMVGVGAIMKSCRLKPEIKLSLDVTDSVFSTKSIS